MIGKWIRLQQRQVQYLSTPYPQTKGQLDINQARNAVYALFEKHSNPGNFFSFISRTLVTFFLQSQCKLAKVQISWYHLRLIK